MFKNKSVDVHRFAMIPKSDVPRSSFRIQKTHKTTMDAGYLVPIYLDEVLPGDTFNLRMTAFARLSTPLFPTMDNLHIDSFFFFVPNRLVWRNWVRLMGEQANPDDTTSYVVPQVTSPLGGYAVGSLQDHMGLPTVGQVDAAFSVTHSAMWLRAYNLIWNEWFRDENLQDPVTFDRTSDGPDTPADFVLLRRGKRKDYFTGALPWPQKGDPVQVPLGLAANVIPNPAQGFPVFQFGSQQAQLSSTNASNSVNWDGVSATSTSPAAWVESGLIADLSTATAATINQLRQSFQVQRLLERDARGGTRYTELIRAHFGVLSPDSRLQRPEYLGGGSSPVTLSPIAQTQRSDVDATPLGTLGAMGTAVHGGHGFSQSFVEHGMIIGLVMVRADLTYQQGLRKMWSRKTRYDYYWPAFSHLGEQAVLNKEIYCRGDPVIDEGVFGFQERWSEYRYNPSEITSLFRSTAALTLDAWHYAQHFLALPTLNATFIEERPPLERTLAVGAEAAGQQFIVDTFFQTTAARPMPMYSVPGLIDHF